MKKEIAIIGYGRFGRTAAHFLKKQFRVVVADSRRIRTAERGVRIVPIETAAAKPSVILAVPINQVAVLLKRIAPFLAPGALVCDMCSVKVQPIRWMKQLLPKNVDIVGMHPLFGPDSASTSLRQRSVVLCPARIGRARFRRVQKTIMKMGLTVISMTPSRHDRLMASTLFLTQLVGRGLMELNLPQTSCSTQHFQFLQRLVQTAKNDTRELFLDMYRYNRFAKPIPAAVMASFRKTRRSLPRMR